MENYKCMYNHSPSPPPPPPLSVVRKADVKGPGSRLLILACPVVCFLSCGCCILPHCHVAFRACALVPVSQLFALPTPSMPDPQFQSPRQSLPHHLPSAVAPGQSATAMALALPGTSLAQTGRRTSSSQPGQIIARATIPGAEREEGCPLPC